MLPSDAVSVTPAVLEIHAGHINNVAADIAQAREAAAATAPDPDAYGRLCQVVPSLLSELQGVVVDGIAVAEQSLHDSAHRIQQTAANYRESDNRAAVVVRRAGRLR